MNLRANEGREEADWKNWGLIAFGETVNYELRSLASKGLWLEKLAFQFLLELRAMFRSVLGNRK